MRTLCRRLAFATILVGACDEPDAPPWRVPEIVAISKYIEYGTWADSAHVCMDEKLAEMDRFIEEIAVSLEVAVPAEPIVYVWHPSPPEEEDWPCLDGAACHTRISNRGYIHSILPFGVQTTFHEFVHGVDTAALGQGHPVFEEGVAEYLNSPAPDQTPIIPDMFSERFSAMLEEGVTQYGLAKHFVGSVIVKHGVEGFKRLRSAVPTDAGYQEFSAAYQRSLGGDLGAALLEMEQRPISGQFPRYCDGEDVPWPEPGDLEVTLRGSCGDGFFWCEGQAEGIPSSWKDFVLDVPAAGNYSFMISTITGESAGSFAVLESCPGTQFGNILSIDGLPGHGLLYPGRHHLRLGVPADAPAMTANLKLEFQPLPP